MADLFKSLLEQLSCEHDRVVSELRADLALCNAQLGISAGDASEEAAAADAVPLDDASPSSQAIPADEKAQGNRKKMLLRPLSLKKDSQETGIGDPDGSLSPKSPRVHPDGSLSPSASAAPLPPPFATEPRDKAKTQKEPKEHKEKKGKRKKQAGQGTDNPVSRILLSEEDQEPKDDDEHEKPEKQREQGQAEKDDQLEKQEDEEEPELDDQAPPSVDTIDKKNEKAPLLIESADAEKDKDEEENNEEGVTAVPTLEEQIQRKGSSPEVTQEESERSAQRRVRLAEEELCTALPSTPDAEAQAGKTISDPSTAQRPTPASALLMEAGKTISDPCTAQRPTPASALLMDADNRRMSMASTSSSPRTQQRAAISAAAVLRANSRAGKSLQTMDSDQSDEVFLPNTPTGSDSNQNMKEDSPKPFSILPHSNTCETLMVPSVSAQKMGRQNKSSLASCDEDGQDELGDYSPISPTSYRRGATVSLTRENSRRSVMSQGLDFGKTMSSQPSRQNIVVDDQDLMLHEFWETLLEDLHESEQSSDTNDDAGRKAAQRSVLRSSPMTIAAMKSEKKTSCCQAFSLCHQRFIASPSSRKRLIWDVIGVSLLTQDLIMVPLQVFELEEEAIHVALRWISALFWSFDILASFLVGYHSKGIVEMRPYKVAGHYFKSWFFLDILLVSMDWLFLVFIDTKSSASSSSAMRLGKISRAIRALRLIRLMKFRVILSEVTGRVHSEEWRTAIHICQLIIIIVFVNHYLGCGFYALHYIRDDGDTWVAKNFREDAGNAYRYATSLHWSLTQFTPASMEVVPVNAVERFFTVCVLLCALVIFSSFISSITTAMTYLRTYNSKKMQDYMRMHRYLAEHHISAELTSRVVHFVQERSQQIRSQARTLEEDVELFGVLPDSLKAALRREAFIPVLQGHPMFNALYHFEGELVGEFAKMAIREKKLVARDELYGHGKAVTHMLFVTAGCLSYRYKVHGNFVTDLIKASEWACEIAIWCNKPEHCLPFVADSNTDLAMLSADEFRKCIEKHTGHGFVSCLAKYGAKYFMQVSQISRNCRKQSVVCNSEVDCREIADLTFPAPQTSGWKRRSSAFGTGIRRSTVKSFPSLGSSGLPSLRASVQTS